MMQMRQEANDEAMMLEACDPSKIRLQSLHKLLRPSKPQISIEFSDLCYSVVHHKREKPEKTILHNVTGHFEPRKVTVIIGPSGAGKTTLLKIISGKRLTNVKGTVTVNGVEWGTFRKQVCYVPQQFDLHPFLTTRETLYIAARLKLDINQNKEAISLIVNNIAEKLNLSNCLNTLANKLSGGERKRLSIGVEMIIKPSVLFLDEPTSGLDSMASNQLVNMLHDMARENCTVVCAIHQPSSQMISFFDDIMVLNQGRCMYCGPMSEILVTYSTAGFTCPNFYNIAEFVLEVVTRQRGENLETLYQICCHEYKNFRLRYKHNENESTNSKQKYETGDINNTIPEISTWQQQKVLFSRALLCMKRDNISTKLRLILHVINGLLLGLIFYKFGDDAEKVYSNISCLFFFMLFLFFANAMPAIQMFPTEMTVFLQEHLNNWYSLRAYYSVKILTDLPILILCASSFFFTAYYMTGQPMESIRFLQMWGICLLITILGQTSGVLMGATFGTELGIFLVPAIYIPLLLISGFFLKIKEMLTFLQPLSFVSLFRYTFEGILQAIYLNRPNLSCSEIYCHMRSPNKILSLMNVPSMPFYVILIVLGFWLVCLHIITYAILCWKIHYLKK